MAHTALKVLVPALLCSNLLIIASTLGDDGGGNAKAEDLKGLAEAMLDEVSQRYRGFSTYADVATIRYVVETTDAADDVYFAMPSMPDQEVRLFLAAPNRIAVSNQTMELHSDGSRKWLAVPMFGQYIEEEAPETWADILLGDHAQMIRSSLSHPVLNSLLRGDERAAEFQSSLVEVTAIREEEREGKRGTLIRGALESPQHTMMTEDPFPFEIWIDAETNLIAETRVDMTAMYNQMMRQMAQMRWDDEDDDELFDEDTVLYEKFEFIVQLRDVRINEEVPEERFVFANDDEFDKVDEFDFMGSRRVGQYVMLGDPAPEFTAPTLEGGELSLSDLRGKVVLLDFWALWCSPCVQALPHIQKIAERFEDKPVVVLGVNRDPDGSEDRINRLLERREITFGHVLDPDGEVSSLYHITGIPATVLIDPDGVVQDVGVGFHPGKVDEVSEQIEKLLAGEPLRTEEEIAELRAQAAEAEESGTVMHFPGRSSRAQEELEEQLAEALGDAPKVFESNVLPRNLASQAWNLRLFDIDGDGTKRAVMPHQRELRIINFQTGGMERIELSGVRSGSAVHGFDLLDVDGEKRWIVAFSRGGGMFGRQSVALGLFTFEGENLWMFTPELPRDVNPQFGRDALAADLTGDGVDEVIVTLQVWRMPRRGGGMMQAHTTQILVLDQTGALLARGSAGGHVYGMSIADGRAEDGRKSIICIADHRALWLELRDGEPELSMVE